MTNNQAERSIRPAVVGRQKSLWLEKPTGHRGRCALLLADRHVPDTQARSNEVLVGCRNLRYRNTGRNPATARVSRCSAPRPSRNSSGHALQRQRNARSAGRSRAAKAPIRACIYTFSISPSALETQLERSQAPMLTLHPTRFLLSGPTENTTGRLISRVQSRPN